MNSNTFLPWLTDTLLTIDKEFDTKSLVPYIHDILKTEDDDDERKDALSYLFENQENEPAEEIVQRIIDKYRLLFDKKDDEVISNAMPAADFDRHLADIMRRQATVTENSQSTAGKCKGISISNSKAAILAQYAQEDSEGEDEDDTVDLQESENTNSKKIDDAEKLKREKMKNEHEMKKQKNKEDSEKQVQKAKDRKEKVKEKTQKGERRR